MKKNFAILMTGFLSVLPAFAEIPTTTCNGTLRAFSKQTGKSVRYGIQMVVTYPTDARLYPTMVLHIDTPRSTLSVPVSISGRAISMNGRVVSYYSGFDLPAAVSGDSNALSAEGMIYDASEPNSFFFSGWDHSEEAIRKPVIVNWTCPGPSHPLQ